MSRRTGGDGSQLFRVVVDVLGAGNFPRRSYSVGPYGTLAAAKAAVTRETHSYSGSRLPNVEATIERAETKWEAIE